MKMDLVASFKFTKDHWPDEPFEPIPDICRKKEFLVVPKSPKGKLNDTRERIWRLSFQEQERELLEGKERFKPALRLIKKLRNTQGQSMISSYFLKSLFLNETMKNKNPEFWHCSLSYMFMHMLQAYLNALKNENIPYYWNGKNNLLKGINKATLENYKNKLNKIVDVINKKYENQPDIIVDYICKYKNIFLLNALKYCNCTAFEI